MEKGIPWNEQVDVISSDESSSSSDSEIEVRHSHSGKQLLTNDAIDQPTTHILDQPLKDITSEGIWTFENWDFVLRELVNVFVS